MKNLSLDFGDWDVAADDCTHIAGVDEAGRGPWAGSVFAAAVILNPNDPSAGLNDSKKLSAKKREVLAREIKKRALAFGIACANVEEIDSLNILNATFLAMRRAVEQLQIQPQKILIDGNRTPPDLNAPSECVVKGDSKIACIAAASILAKTARDEEMQMWDKKFPHYEFARHKGYGTARHWQLLKIFGACAIHRTSFSPVKRVLAEFSTVDTEKFLKK